MQSGCKCNTAAVSLTAHLRGCRLPLRPLRDLIQVERLPDLGRTRDGDGNEVTATGIIIPQDYKARGSAKAVNKADYFRARVLAVGPKVRDVAAGDEVLVLTWGASPDGSRRSLYVGIDGPDGTLFVTPDDLVCGVNAVPSAWPHPKPGDVLAEWVAPAAEPRPRPTSTIPESDRYRDDSHEYGG